MNRSRNIACALIVFIILMVVIPLIFAVRIKEFDNLIKDKNAVIQELQTEKEELNKTVNELKTTVKNLEEESSKLNNDYVILLRDYEELKQECEVKEEEQDNEVTVEENKQEELRAEKPVVRKEEPTTQKPTEESTTEVVTEYDEETTEEPEIFEDQSGDGGLLYSEVYPRTDNHLTRSNGVVYYNGHKETWYSTNEPGQTVTARSIPGKHVADDGTIRDEDGYICVASSDLSFYTVVQTTLGPGKVYDCGCSHGTIDIYTSW